MQQPDTRGMTDSSETSRPSATPSSLSSSALEPVTPPSPRSRLWPGVARLLILGLGVSLGWVVGVLVAQVWPSRQPQPPLQERVMRQTGQALWKVRQLPQWWQGGGNPVVPVAEPPPAAITGNLTPSPEADDSGNPEVVTLQRELTRIETRLAEMERQAGRPGTGSVSERLQQLAETEDTSAPAESPASSTSSPDEPPVEAAADTPEPTEADAADTPPAADGLGRQATTPYPDPAFPVVSERVVLPSALLFVPGESLLTPAGEQLLDAVVPDLRRYGAVTLLVGSHTDGPLEAEAARQMTFQQALAIQAYLAAQLEDTGSRWVALGYGKTRPLAVGDAPGTEARNQRVEIGLVRP